MSFSNVAQLWPQFAAVGATIVYSATATFVILRVVSLFAPVRASVREEGVGLDVTQHGEEAYSRGEGAILIRQDRREVPR